MGWIHINDQKPAIEQDVFYFFEELGMYKGKYSQVGDEEMGYPPGVFSDCFYGKSGFLTDDVTHWMPAPTNEEWDGIMPEIPEGFIKVDNGRFSGWAEKENTLVVRKDEFESLKETLRYCQDGHLFNMVCPDCPLYHIYWEEEDDGYKCPTCNKTYATEEVENNPSKYRAKE